MNIKIFRTFFCAVFFISLFSFPPASRASAGDLVKGSLSAVYYVTPDNKRLAFPDEAAYFSWYADFGQVQTLTDDQIAVLPLTGLVTMRPGTRIVKTVLDPKVYAVSHGGVMRWLASESVATMIFGADWSKKVTDLPEAFLTAYTHGDDITAGGQYWWQKERDASPTISADRTPIPNTDAATVLSPALQAASGPVLTRNLLAILWDPQDPAEGKLPDSKTIEDLIFGSGKSVKTFYDKESGGKAQIKEAGFFGWYPALKPYSHYWATPDPTDADKDGFINGHNEKWVESIKDADPTFDYAAYDANHDGRLDPSELGILIVIPAASPFGTNRPVLGQEFPTAQPLVVDGVTITNIAEVYTGVPVNFGVFAHELGHLLFNFTDMYANTQYRAASYSLMDASYCNCEIDPWEKAVEGWVNMAVPQADGTYALEDIATSHTAMKIARPGTDEFFLIENRETGTQGDVSDPGLLVWDILSQSTAGDWGRDNIHLLRSNGGTPVNDSQAAYHSNGSVAVTSAKLKWSDGTDSGVALSDVGPAGKIMQFNLRLK